MKATILTGGVNTPSVMSRGNVTTIESYNPGGLVIRLEDLSTRSGIKKVVEIGLAADNGDLYLLLEMNNGPNQTIRINSETVQVVGHRPINL